MTRRGKSAQIIFPSNDAFTAFTVFLFNYIQLFREKLSKKCTKVHATRPKGDFANWPRGNKQLYIFAREEFIFRLRRPLSVALLLLSHVPS